MIVTRFAPSPTGYLHLGHAFAALNAWKRARNGGGSFLLRLEDIDQARCRPEYATAIQEDLAWLGLDWDGSVRVQSEHLAEYQEAIGVLVQRELVYPCFCTRAAIMREIAASAAAQHDPGGAPLYPGTCRQLTAVERAQRIAAGAAFALRLDMSAAVRCYRSALAAGAEVGFEEEAEGRIACQPERFGDVVLARKDVAASYHLCVTHDDAAQGVTHVTRGLDLKPATDLHRLIQSLMGWPAPIYAHHPILTDAAGRRLAKRDAAVSLRSLRADGVSPRAVLEQIDQFQ